MESGVWSLKSESLESESDVSKESEFESEL